MLILQKLWSGLQEHLIRRKISFWLPGIGSRFNRISSNVLNTVNWLTRTVEKFLRTKIEHWNLSEVSRSLVRFNNTVTKKTFSFVWKSRWSIHSATSIGIKKKISTTSVANILKKFVSPVENLSRVANVPLVFVFIKLLAYFQLETVCFLAPRWTYAHGATLISTSSGTLLGRTIGHLFLVTSCIVEGCCRTRHQFVSINAHCNLAARNDTRSWNSESQPRNF